MNASPVTAARKGKVYTVIDSTSAVGDKRRVLLVGTLQQWDHWFNQFHGRLAARAVVSDNRREKVIHVTPFSPLSLRNAAVAA